MQDRFKFRHWDKQINKMRYGDIQLGCNGIPFIISPELPKLVQDIDDVITMQCTGLKDKNGKLIYEGDIVKFKTPRTGLHIGQVKFDADCALFEVRYLDITNNWELMDKYNYEVIGNIYENPALLENTD